MRLLALQTDKNKIIERYCHDGECIVLMTYYHGLSFFFAILREIVITLGLMIVAIVGIVMGWPLLWTLGTILILWFVFVFFNLTRAYIDWLYDFIIVTTDKVILVDQSSIFRQEVNPIHIDNIGGISTDTQFWNLFPFGILTFQLKEGLGGEDIVKRYVPHVEEVASKISDVITQYQQRQYLRAGGATPGMASLGQEAGPTHQVGQQPVPPPGAAPPNQPPPPPPPSNQPPPAQPYPSQPPTS